MTMLKRFFLFGLVNILVVITLSTVAGLLGIGHYTSAGGLQLEQLMAFCLLWGMGGAFISLLMSKFMAKTMMGVQIVDAHGPYQDIVQMVHRFAKQAGLNEMPEVGVYESPEINAFATGPTKNNSLVAVSTGLLRHMNRQEVEGVIGHEVAHIANGDMVTMTLIQGVMNAFVMFLARIVAFFVDQALRSNSDRDGERGGLGGLAHFGVIMVCEIVFGILGSIVVSAFSRWREFRADAGCAKMAGKTPMIQALKALQKSQESLLGQNTEFNAMKISSKKSWLSLFSTHPSLEERIEALERLPG